MARNVVLKAGRLAALLLSLFAGEGCLFPAAAASLPEPASKIPAAADDESSLIPSPGGPLRAGPGRLTPEVRQRLSELLQLPKEKLLDELMKWPTFQQMTLQEQGRFLGQLAEMRQRTRSQALKKATEMGLKIPPEREEAFVRSYLRERLEMERKLWDDLQPKRRALEAEMTANLSREFAQDTTPKP